MDEDGNIYFVVYGYMNRGVHEGKNGMSLYYYSAESMTTQELFFVECDENYDIMKKETGRFTYYNAQTNTFYYLLDETLYEVSLADMTQTAIVEGIPSAKYLVSANRKLVAYPNAAEDENVTAITIQNFETGETYEKTCATGDLLLALGFVENDLIYGCAHSADVIMTSDGQAIPPLYELFIMSDNGEQKKDYTKDGVYIMNASVGDDTIYLTRARKQNQFFEEIDQDYISYKKEENNKMITTDTTYDSYAWNILDIVFPSNFYLSDTASYRKTKYGRAEAYKDMQVETQMAHTMSLIMRGIQVNMRLPEVRSHVWSMMRQDLLWTATEIRSIAVWQRTAIIQSQMRSKRRQMRMQISHCLPVPICVHSMREVHWSLQMR